MRADWGKRMSIEEILDFLRGCSKETEIQFRVAMHCGPVLKKVKVSNVMMVRSGGGSRIWEALKNSSIICTPLYQSSSRELLLFYRQKQLGEHLNRKENREFLKDFGYQDIKAEGVISRLRQRYWEYLFCGEAFPHEMGIILGFPVEDVAGFMEHQGKDCLLQRYWKVYHNLEQAKATFAQYDQAREQAMKEVASGLSLGQVAVV